MTATPIEMKTTTWAIDSAHTDTQFAVRHLMISTVRGRFGAVTGSVEFDSENIGAGYQGRRGDGLEAG